MEKMGGGGHQTMAAAQLKGTTMEAAREKLVEIVSSINSDMVQIPNSDKDTVSDFEKKDI